jgi:hypothetical protein
MHSLSFGCFINISRFLIYNLSRGCERRLHHFERRTNIAYVIAHFFPGGTKEQSEASIAAVHPTRDSLPKGQIVHAAGASPGGWTIVAVHDSKESWERSVTAP